MNARDSEALVFIVTVYDSERIQMKISIGKKHMGEGLGETRYKLLGILQVKSHRIT